MKIDWKIIRNWALGEASEKEKQEVERWGEMGEENRNFLEDTYNYYCEESMVENPSPEYETCLEKIGSLQADEKTSDEADEFGCRQCDSWDWNILGRSFFLRGKNGENFFKNDSCTVDNLRRYSA